VQQGDGPRFSPDGKQVIYATSWKGTIRLIDIDGSNDRVFVQAADQTFIARPHFSPDGKHIAAVSHDLQNGSLHADPKVSHPHLVIYDAGNPELHVLELPVQEDSTFYPTGELEWR